MHFLKWTASSIAISLITACGSGGGGDSPAAAVVPAAAAAPTFPFASAYKTLVAAGSATKNYTATGACSGSAAVTESPSSGGAVFETASAITATQTFVLATNCTTAPFTQTTVSYYDINYTPLGNETLGAYTVYSSFTVPTTVKVGDTGTLGSGVSYKDNTKSITAGNTVITYTVEADTSTTAVIKISATLSTTSGYLISTEHDRYRIGATGPLIPVSIDMENNAGITSLK